MHETRIIGVDIGGTSISAGLIVGNKVVKTTTIPTESYKSKVEVCDNLYAAINSVLDVDVEAIGIGVPGVIDDVSGEIITITNIPAWNGFGLTRAVEKQFGLTTYLENDANCFVLGVKHFGEGKPFSNIVGITLGTGLGAGIIIRNKIYKGLCNGAGEICFIPYLDSNLESYCSGSFFSKLKNAKGEILFDKARNGDSNALAVWEEYGIHIGALLRIIMLCYAPEMIAFGGSLSKAFSLFNNSMLRSLNNFELNSLFSKSTIVPINDMDIAVKGAAAQVFEKNQ